MSLAACAGDFSLTSINRHIPGILCNFAHDMSKDKQFKLGIFLPATLGMLTAFGPFVTDFYLPSMPEMAEYFKTSPAAVSTSLTAAMIGLAAGQILIGPFSDKYGRRRPLIASMLLFSIASVLCMFAPNIHVFNAFRVLQGIGGAGGVVLAKSYATDMFKGKQLADFLALLGAINGIAPVCAPIIGGTLTNFTSWQGVFCALLVIGIILLVCSMRLKETLPVEKRSKNGLGGAYSRLFGVFRNRRFTLSTVAMMFCFFTFFSYITASPFIFQKIYGLTPFEYSLCFGLNALCIGIGALLPTKFHHPNTAMKWASIDMLIATILVAACQIAHAPLAVLMPCYIYTLICFGIMQPVTTAIAMDSERNNAGAASAIFGASNFVAGALASPLVAMGNVLVTSAIIMVAGAAGCAAFAVPLAGTIKREAIGKQ